MTADRYGTNLINLTTIKRIEKVNISEAVLQQIKDNIIMKVWPAGTKLPSENELAEMFGVSRVSVRTAQHKLMALNILEKRNGEGTFVKDVNAGSAFSSLLPMLVLEPRDILEILELRTGIETLSCALAAKRATEEDIGKLEIIAGHMKINNEQKAIEEYTKYDFDFHILISKMSGNSIIENIMMILFDTYYAHLLEMNRAFDPAVNAERHIKVFEAIRSRDERAASFYMQECLSWSIEKYKELCRDYH
jgi:DNA-binding FadR family transcriptional regulator